MVGMGATRVPWLAASNPGCANSRNLGCAGAATWVVPVVVTRFFAAKPGARIPGLPPGHNPGYRHFIPGLCHRHNPGCAHGVGFDA